MSEHMPAKSVHLTRREALLAGASAALVPALATGLTTPALAKAPMLGADRPTHNRFKLGNFEITTIFDGGVALDGPHPIFGNNQSAEEVQKLAEANFLPGTRMEIGFTPVVVNTGSEVVLFDTGNGAARRPNAGLLSARLAAAGFSADQIDVVVITHMHPDHIGGLLDDGKPVFPNARIVTGETEYNFWSPIEKASGPTERVGKLVQANVVPMAEKTSFLKPEGDVVSGITAIKAFGHTPGHMAYHIESEGKRFLLWADACNHYVVSLQRPDWHVSFDMDKDMAVASRKALLDMAAADKIPCAGYHMPFPAVGYVDKKDSGYRWVPASYQLFL